MDDLRVARLLHLLAIVVWFGGVAFVTLVVLPRARALGVAEGRALFEAMEAAFSAIARWAVTVAGLSGLWLLWRLDLWYRFATAEFWWMHAMAGLWLVFALVLFVLEPLWLHRAFHRWAERDGRALDWAFHLHLLLLLAGAITIAGAVTGSH